MEDMYNYSTYLSIFKIMKFVQSKMSFKSAFAYNTTQTLTCPVTQLHSCVCLINASWMLPCTVAVGRRAHICSHTCSLPLELAPTRACSCGWKALMLQTELRCSLLKVATGRDWCTEYTCTCGCGRAGVVGSHTQQRNCPINAGASQHASVRGSRGGFIERYSIGVVLLWHIVQIEGPWQVWPLYTKRNCNLLQSTSCMQRGHSQLQSIELVQALRLRSPCPYFRLT